MNQSIFMQTDIHEGAEVHYIADRSAELIADLQILEFQHIASQQCGFKLIAVIAQRLADGFFDILQRIRIDAERADLIFRELRIRSSEGRDSACLHDFAGRIIRLRMNAGLIERFITAHDA